MYTWGKEVLVLGLEVDEIGLANRSCFLDNILLLNG